MSRASRIDAQLAQLDKLRAQREQLYSELHRSLALEKLAPAVFSGRGKVKTEITGGPNAGFRLEITSAAGRTHSVKVERVPVALLPSEFLADIKTNGWKVKLKE